MEQEKFDRMCKTFINIVLDPLIHKDEPDARYDIQYSFNPASFKIDFYAIKNRNPKYAIQPYCTYLGAYDSYKIEECYDEYMKIRAKFRFQIDWWKER